MRRGETGTACLSQRGLRWVLSLAGGPQPQPEVHLPAVGQSLSKQGKGLRLSSQEPSIGNIDQRGRCLSLQSQRSGRRPVRLLTEVSVCIPA